MSLFVSPDLETTFESQTLFMTPPPASHPCGCLLERWLALCTHERVHADQHDRSLARDGAAGPQRQPAQDNAAGSSGVRLLARSR